MAYGWLWDAVVASERYFEAAKPVISVLTFGVTLAVAGITSHSALAIRSLRLRIDELQKERDDLKSSAEVFAGMQNVAGSVDNIAHRDLRKLQDIGDKLRTRARLNLNVPADETFYGLFYYKSLRWGDTYIGLTEAGIHAANHDRICWDAFVSMAVDAETDDRFSIGDVKITVPGSARSYAKVFKELQFQLES